MRFLRGGAGARYRPILDWHDEGLREWVRLSLPLMVGRIAGDGGQLDHCALCVSNTSGAISLIDVREAAVYGADVDAGAGRRRGFDAVFREPVGQRQNRFEFASTVADSVSRVTCMGLLAASAMICAGQAGD